jgi:putative transposase
MVSVGNPYENARAESFLRVLKMEEVYLKGCRTFEDAYENMAELIEECYNQERLHPVLGCVPPQSLRQNMP